MLDEVVLGLRDTILAVTLSMAGMEPADTHEDLNLDHNRPTGEQPAALEPTSGRSKARKSDCGEHVSLRGVPIPGSIRILGGVRGSGAPECPI